VQKKREKIQHVGHFFGHTLGKKLRFCAFWSKNRKNRDLVGMICNFANTSIKIHIEDLQNFVALWIFLDLFWFFDWNAQNRNWCFVRNCT